MIYRFFPHMCVVLVVGVGPFRPAARFCDFVVMDLSRLGNGSRSAGASGYPDAERVTARAFRR